LTLDIVDLRSDTFTLPTAQMYESVRTASLGDDVYGEDPTVARLEEKAAELTGKAAGLFVTSGTQGNLTALMAMCQRGDEVLLGAGSDLFNFETGGISAIAGLFPRPLDDSRGWIEPLTIASAVRPRDVHFGTTRVAVIENSHARSGGTPIPIAVLEEIAAAAREKGLLLHMDGARLFNAAVALDVPAAAITAHVDTVTFCLSKGLGAPAGALVCGPSDVIDRARLARKMLGGGMRQAGWIAAPGLIALENRDRLQEDHARARRLALALQGLPGIAVDPARVRTNMVIVGIEPPVPSASVLITALRAEGVRCFSLGQQAVRLVVHHGISDACIDRAVEAFQRATITMPETAAGGSGPY
jgi:threonine aldolase